MEDIIEWWINYQKLSDIDSLLLNQVRPKLIEIDHDEYARYERKLFELMPMSNIDRSTRKLTVSECATDFINQLFDKYVDDNTLVITSSCEHDNVKSRVRNCKNFIELDYYDEIQKCKIQEVISSAKKFSKVFIYIIGTQISTGEITPQIFFTSLINKLQLYKIPYTLVLDDVHGMFLVPRDYSIFDYVICTAHALIREFDMGLLISKQGEFGQRIINWNKSYLEALRVLLARESKLRLFSYIMEEYFADKLNSEDYSVFTHTSPHIFSLKVRNHRFTRDMYEELFKYEIRLEGDLDSNEIVIRFRGAQFIKRPEFLREGLKLLEAMLEVNKMEE